MNKHNVSDLEIEAAYDALDLALGYTDSAGVIRQASPEEIERLRAVCRELDGGPF